MRRSGLSTVVATVLLILVGVALGIPAPAGACPLRPRRRGRRELDTSGIGRLFCRSCDRQRSSGGSSLSSEPARLNHFLYDNRTSAACAPGEEPDVIGTAESRPDVSRSPPFIPAAGRRAHSGVATRPSQKGFAYAQPST